MLKDIPQSQYFGLERLVKRLTELEKENLTLKFEVVHLRQQVDAKVLQQVKKFWGKK